VDGACGGLWLPEFFTIAPAPVIAARRHEQPMNGTVIVDLRPSSAAPPLRFRWLLPTLELSLATMPLPTIQGAVARRIATVFPKAKSQAASHLAASAVRIDKGSQAASSERRRAWPLHCVPWLHETCPVQPFVV